MKAKRFLTALCALVLFISVCSSSVYAHNFTGYGTNVQTKYYLNGEYQRSEYSWGGNDHPYLYIEEYETVSAGVYHIGMIPKVNVTQEGPSGVITPEGESTQTIYYHATYHGWIECRFLPVTINN